MMPRSALPEWEGCDPPSKGRLLSARSRWNHRNAAPTDYDRASDVDGFVGIVSVGKGYALVLGDLPVPTAWLPHGNECGTLFRWIALDGTSRADGTRRLINEKASSVPDSWLNDEPFTLNVTESPLALFDSAYSGHDISVGTISQWLLIDLLPGEYAVATAYVRQEDRSEFILHRLTRIA